jgi:hypothetical protein
MTLYCDNIKMSDQEIEKTLMVIESEILTLNLENALQLASSMKLEESKVKDKSIVSVIRKLLYST